jgi:hypothetical protein
MSNIEPGSPHVQTKPHRDLISPLQRLRYCFHKQRRRGCRQGDNSSVRASRRPSVIRALLRVEAYPFVSKPSAKPGSRHLRALHIENKTLNKLASSFFSLQSGQNLPTGKIGPGRARQASRWVDPTAVFCPGRGGSVPGLAAVQESPPHRTPETTEIFPENCR